MPGEEEQRQPDGILTSGESAPDFGDRGAGADGTVATRSAPSRNDAQRRSSGASTPTTITAIASPRQQVMGHDVTITGTLTADGTPVAEAFVTLYNADDIIELVPVATTSTDDEGFFQFTLTDTVTGHYTYVVRSPGTAAYEPSASAEMVITFVTISTTITATASPRQQVIGHDVTITGTLTADGTPVADASVALCNADDITELVPIATTTTDAAGDYQFILTDAAPGHHTYVVCSPGDSPDAHVQSAEMVITFVTISTTITATASPRQQVIGHDVTITGTLTADGTPVADASVALCNADDITELVPIATTTTDAAGDYQFILTDAAPGHHTYVVRSPGTAAYEPSESAKMVITYVTISIPITATASPPQQFIGRDVTITGRLTDEGFGLSALPVTLYKTDAAEKVSVAATATDASGYYQFTLTDTVPGHYTYVVCSPGTAAYEPSVSKEVSVTYVTIPTTLTATAAPRQQVVGHDVTITGRLTDACFGLSALPVTLYKTDAAEKVPVAATTTDAAGDYQFTLTDTAAATHVYMACAGGDSTYSPAQSTDLLVAYTALPAEVPAVKARRSLNLAWYEILSIVLILAAEGLLFAGFRLLGVGVQALNIVAVAAIVVALHGERVQLVTALALISAFRVVSFSFALVPTVTIYWLTVIYGVMYLPLISVIVHEKMSRYDLGIANVRRSVLLVPLGAVVGTGFAFIEHAILANGPLIANASAIELIQLSIVMIFFAAVVEELLFRVLLQPQLINRSGAVAGILITSVIFGAMHAGFANVYELLFATAAGVVLGVAFYKTRDLALVVTIQAVNNIVLFGMLGFLPR